MKQSRIDDILQEQIMLFGNQFTARWGNLDYQKMVDFWSRKLEGFADKELQRGYNLLETLKYPPSLPEFIQLCRPPVDPVKAYHEAVKGVQDRRHGKHGEWSHPAVFWTAASMSHDLLNLPYQQVKPHFEKKLESELSRTTWQAIPPVSESLPAPKVDREKGRKEAEKMLKRVGFSIKTSDSGNTDWIRYNLKRLKEGWKPTQAVRMMVLNTARMNGIPLPQGVN